METDGTGRTVFPVIQEPVEVAAGEHLLRRCGRRNGAGGRNGRWGEGEHVVQSGGHYSAGHEGAFGVTSERLVAGEDTTRRYARLRSGRDVGKRADTVGTSTLLGIFLHFPSNANAIDLLS